MSHETCVTRKVTYDPPCFLGDDNEPICEYDVTECGISLSGVSRNAETERFFKAAERSGHSDILSDEDISRQVLDELGGASTLLPGGKQALRENVNRFKIDAETYFEKFR